MEGLPSLPGLPGRLLQKSASQRTYPRTVLDQQQSRWYALFDRLAQSKYRYVAYLPHRPYDLCLDTGYTLQLVDSTRLP